MTILGDPIISSLIFYFFSIVIVAFFLYKKTSYRSDILTIVDNIFLLYKNFWHWNISKIIIMVYSILLGFILSTPFLSLLILFIYKASLVITNKMADEYLTNQIITGEMRDALISNSWIFIGIVVSFSLILLIFIISFTYSFFLQHNLCKNYIEKNKLPYFGNFFVAYKVFYKFAKITFWNILILMIPIIIGIIYIISLALLSFIPGLKDVIFSDNTFISGIQIIIPIILFFWLIYLSIRTVFSLIIFLFEMDLSKKALDYIKSGFKLTKGKVFKIFTLGFPFLVLYMIIRDIELIISDLGFIISWIVYILNFMAIFGISYMVFISIYNILIGNTFKEILEIPSEQKTVIKETAIKNTDKKEIKEAKKTSTKKSSATSKTKEIKTKKISKT